MADDIQLLRHYAATRAGDAFAALVERHVALVYSAALRQLGGAVHRAEDVTQTVFIELARQAAALARRDDIVGWLYTTTHHTAARLKRTEARRQRREQEAHTMHELSSEFSTEAPWERLQPVLDAAMHELPEPDRQAILLRFFKNERFAEVGRRLGLTEDAARMRVERALDKLHELLAKRGVTSTASGLGIALANQAVAIAPAGLAPSVTGAALSGAAIATGAGSLATVSYFMSASKIGLSLAVAGALATGLAVYQSSQARAVAKEVNQIRDANAALTSRIGNLEAEVEAAEQQKAQREILLERARTEKAATATAAKMRQLAADEVRKKQEKALQDFLNSDPELLKLRYDTNVAEYKTSYAVIRAGLSAEKKDSNARRNADFREKNEARDSAGLEPLRIPGGPTPKWEANVTANMHIPKALYYLDEPYTPELAARLQTVLRNAQTSTQTSTGDNSNVAFYARFDWERIYAEAASFLSPARLQALRGLEAWGREATLRAAAAKEAAASSSK